MSDQKTEAEQAAEVGQRGFSRPQAPAGDEQGGTCVPEAPPQQQSTTRTLGPGSVGGSMCADPEMKFTSTGKAMVKVRLAVAPRVKDENTGFYTDGKTEFIDVTVFGKQGENVMESLRKGDRVVVNGIWQESRWFGQDEQWHAGKSITARDIGPSLLFRQARVHRHQVGA
jgi:single-strand DNA-binding protein